MKCLSIRQPWAWAILHGGKDIENRNWTTHYRGPLAIHAGKQFDIGKADWDAYSRDMFGEPWTSMARGYNQQPGHVLGAIIGVVDLVDCLPSFRCSSPWKAGPDPDYYCWKLANPRALETPIPYKGQLGLFDLPDNISNILQAVKA